MILQPLAQAAAAPATTTAVTEALQALLADCNGHKDWACAEQPVLLQTAQPIQFTACAPLFGLRGALGLSDALGSAALGFCRALDCGTDASAQSLTAPPLALPGGLVLCCKRHNCVSGLSQGEDSTLVQLRTAWVPFRSAALA